MNAVYHLARADYESVYAEATRLGKYEKKPNCPKCGIQRWKRTPPLVIEWVDSSNVIADFTFTGGLSEIMINDRVRSCLVNNSLSGFEFGPVSMTQNPKLKKPVRPNSRSKSRVWLPYNGPQLWELQVTSTCRLNIEKSGWKLVSECDVCHWQDFDIDEKASFEDAPLYIDAHTWDGSDVFMLRELDLVFVTDKAAKALSKARFSNLAIEKRGRILGDTNVNLVSRQN